MNRRSLLKLWADLELKEYIDGQAARHFSCEEDREDAHAEAWERIAGQPRLPSRKDLFRIAYDAINALYKREKRRSQRKCPQQPEEIESRRPRIG